MDPQTKAEFEKLLSKSANKTCIDCNTFNPQWGSVNNGCFMCIKCAGNHRSMGVHITFVRSVTMDGWSNIQLARMKHGGNAKLKRFWSQQKFPNNLTSKQRLNNTAMDKYREQLLTLAKGKQARDIGYIGYTERLDTPNRSFSNLSVGSNGNGNGGGSVASNSNSNLRPKMEGFGNTNYNPNNNNNNSNDDAWNDFGIWASSMAAKTSAVASDLASKSKTAAVSLSSKASEKAATLKTKLGDEEYQAHLKKNAAETWSKTATTLSSWWSTAATSVTNVMNEAFENKDEDNNPLTFYNKDTNNNDHSRKKMAALSSDQYFNKNSYGSSTNHNNKSPQKQKSEIEPKNEDILGMSNGKINKSPKKPEIDNISPPFPKNKPAVKQITGESDDFDDWGFGDEDSEQKKKKSNVQPVDIMQAIAGIPANDNNVESLLDFSDNNMDLEDKKNIKEKEKEKEKDGNSSDDLDAFFDEMEKEGALDNDKKNGDIKKKSGKNDMLDLLGSHGVNDKDKDDEDDWGWN